MTNYYERQIVLLGVFHFIAAKELRVLTFATDENTSGLKRYLQSANHFGLDVKVLGKDATWTFGEVSIGGGIKLNHLKRELSNMLQQNENSGNIVILFSDAYDVVILTEAQNILRTFYSFNANVVIGADQICWPDASLKDNYPIPPGNFGLRYVASGGFIGYAKDVLAILTHHDLNDYDDDQLFMTQVYLDEAFREKHKIVLDHTSKIFQNLYKAPHLIELWFERGRPKLYNTHFETHPLILHANGENFKKDMDEILSNYYSTCFKNDPIVCPTYNICYNQFDCICADLVPRIMNSVHDSNIHNQTLYIDEV